MGKDKEIRNDVRYTVTVGTFSTERAAVERGCALTRAGFTAEVHNDRYIPEMEITAALITVANTLCEIGKKLDDISAKLTSGGIRTPAVCEAKNPRKELPVNDFGSFVRLHRQKKGYSQRELAYKIGVVPSAVTNWETNRSAPRKPTLQILCSVLEIEENEVVPHV